MPPQDPTTPREHAIDIRVRYCECDPMGVAHHSVFAVWFEMGRTELLRQTGQAYRDLEAEGVLLAVVSLQVKFRLPARYDDVLTLTTLACLDRDGRARALPADLSEWPALISEKTA